MRHPIEICLAAWEWAEDKRAKASARKLRKKTEKKSFATFLSQGAVGGAFAYFLVAMVIVVVYRDGYNFLLLIFLPFYLVFGLLFGATTAFFVWLPGRLFKRRFSFLARAVFAMAGWVLLTIPFLYWAAEVESQTPLWWSFVFMCGWGLTMGVVTGSRSKPGRMLVFGAGRRDDRHRLGSWLSVPSGFLLRAASLLGLLEALMAVAVWIAARTEEPPSAPAEDLPAIALILLYFAVSSYISIKTPHKAYLLPAAILLNLPLAAWLANPGPEGFFQLLLVYVSKGLICLWALYTLGRLITPESASGGDDGSLTVVRLDLSGRRTTHLRSVQL